MRRRLCTNDRIRPKVDLVQLLAAPRRKVAAAAAGVVEDSYSSIMVEIMVVKSQKTYQ